MNEEQSQTPETGQKSTETKGGSVKLPLQGNGCYLRINKEKLEPELVSISKNQTRVFTKTGRGYLIAANISEVEELLK